MTTMQSDAPLNRLAANSGQEPVHQVALYDNLILDAPYQRGSVWGLRRRRNLIRSLLLGIPVGNVFLNQRPGIEFSWAVVDGKQRIETILMFLRGELSVPASWFPADTVLETEDTDDGPYVRFTSLTASGQGRFNRCPLTTQRTDLATIEAEADLFNLINFGGVPQGEADED